MSEIHKVAVIGASGNVGFPVVTSLLESGFVVTAITRPESTATFPSEVIVKRIDVNSLQSVTEALSGQDALVSTVTTSAVAMGKIIIDAAVSAKIKRFIPSEFGIDTRELRGTKLGNCLSSKIANIDYLIEVSKKHEGFTWTALATGSWFDWGLRNGIIGTDLKNMTATIFDSGNEPFSATTLPFIGKCVAAILERPNETANKYLAVASFTTTLNKMLKIIEEETGRVFQTTKVNTADVEKIGDEKVAKGDPNGYVQYVIQRLFADGRGHAVKDNAIEVLGLQEQDLRTEIKKVLNEL